MHLRRRAHHVTDVSEVVRRQPILMVVCICVSLPLCLSEVKQDDKQKPQLRKKERQSTDKRNIGIIFVLHLFLVSPSLSASVSTSD